MKKNIVLLVLLAMLLPVMTACKGFTDGEFLSVETYVDHGPDVEVSVVEVRNAVQMCNAVINLVESGAQSGILSVSSFVGGSVHFYMDQAIRQAMETNPMCAYAVETITYEIGTRAGKEAVAPKIQYRCELSHILQMERVTGLADTVSAVQAALLKHENAVVLRVSVFEEMDLVDILRDYAVSNIDRIMELPAIEMSTYPKMGEERIIEVFFTYQAKPDELNRMQWVVEPVFTEAKNSVSGLSQRSEKYEQLYRFLTNRMEYTLDSTAHPVYSLLIDGVGDSEAFARVYAVMCRDAEIFCDVVAGKHEGQQYYWNVVELDGTYYYLDILRCMELGVYELLPESQMGGYTWDRSPYIS